MKSIFIFPLFCVAIFTNAFSQDDESRWFDFWIGKWEVTWTQADGKTGKGTNTVTKILDNTVIQENFKAEEGSIKGYLGTSISVYNPKRKTWHQGYADNEGAYFNFIGERQGEKKIFKTDVLVNGEKQKIQRMVFYDIKDDNFVWDWEASEDGGKTWSLIWRINYQRQ